jgi:murein peptide amidase A
MWQPCNNFDGPAVALAGSMSEHNGYPVRASIGYPTPGSLGSYAGADRQIPTITLELPANHPTARSWNNNREALLAAIQSDPISQSAIRDPQSAIPTAP